MAVVEVPKYQDILWPTLVALKATGGSASIQELSERIPITMALPDEVLEAMHGDGALSEVEYRAAWARTYLKLISAVENSARGVWSLTETGRRIESEDEVRRLVKQARIEYRRERSRKKAAQRELNDETVEEGDWYDGLLDIVKTLSPGAFERLCQRILRESGFTKVEVTGRSGDGGIDGAGVLRVNLLSFHVRFQSKRYAGSVGASEIRDFRGAMVGRADKGLFITTGRFTKEAEREAVRDGAPAIDLIDGIELCNLLKNFGLGVKVEIVEEVTPLPEFFQNV
jgi:restriction system protein